MKAWTASIILPVAHLRHEPDWVRLKQPTFLEVQVEVMKVMAAFIQDQVEQWKIENL